MIFVRVKGKLKINLHTISKASKEQERNYSGGQTQSSVCRFYQDTTA